MREAHPDDVWVDISTFGDAAPVPFLAVDGRETEVNRAKAAYIHDHIDVDELEQRILKALG